MEIDRERIQKAVHAVADRLGGDWLLVGGALVALWIQSRRTTEDVDLVPLGGVESPRHALLNFTHELGLPIEALNSAADFFVERIAGWRDEIEVLHRGTRGTIYRPSPTLFLLLKIGRLSARDFADCDALLSKARAESLLIDTARVRQVLDALPPAEQRATAARRTRLRALLP